MGGIIQDYVCKRGLKIKIDPKQEFTNLLLTKFYLNKYIFSFILLH